MVVCWWQRKHVCRTNGFRLGRPGGQNTMSAIAHATPQHTGSVTERERPRGSGHRPAPVRVTVLDDQICQRWAAIPLGATGATVRPFAPPSSAGHVFAPRDLHPWLMVRRPVEFTAMPRKFGPDYARQLKRRQGRLGDTWFLDEVFVTINGQRQYLWGALDQDQFLWKSSQTTWTGSRNSPSRCPTRSTCNL